MLSDFTILLTRNSASIRLSYTRRCSCLCVTSLLKCFLAFPFIILYIFNNREEAFLATIRSQDPLPPFAPSHHHHHGDLPPPPHPHPHHHRYQPHHQRSNSPRPNHHQRTKPPARILPLSLLPTTTISPLTLPTKPRYRRPELAAREQSAAAAAACEPFCREPDGSVDAGGFGRWAGGEEEEEEEEG